MWINANTRVVYNYIYEIRQAFPDYSFPEFPTDSDFELVDELEKISGVKVPMAIEEIRSAKVLHDTICDKSEMKDAVKAFLKLK